MADSRLQEFAKYRNSPDLYAFLRLEEQKRQIQQNIDQLISDFRVTIENLKKQAQKEITASVKDTLINEMDIASTRGKESAEATIKDFRANTSGRMDSMLKTLERTKNEILGKVENQANTILKDVMGKASKIQKDSETFARKTQDQVSKMKGDPGDPGSDGDDANPEVTANIVLKKLEPKLKEKKPLEIANKLNTKKDIVNQGVIIGLKDALKNLANKITKIKTSGGKGGGGGGGGGMGNVTEFQFTGDGSTTSFTLDANVAANGRAIVAHYQGQYIHRGTHFTVSGITLNTSAGSSSFTPANGAIIEGWFIRR